jgi:uncharacterized protein YodC (DUF2158 family)
MAEIKIGGQVQVISGGPIMTVTDVGYGWQGLGIKDGVMCVWFDDKHKPQEKVLNRPVLKIYTDD